MKNRSLQNINYILNSNGLPNTGQTTGLKHSTSAQPDNKIHIIDEPSKNGLLIIEGKINNHKITILLDPGATNSHLSDKLLRKYKLHSIKNFGTVSMADGKGYLSRKIPMVPFQIGQYHARVDLYSAPLAWDAILGKDWFSV